NSGSATLRRTERSRLRKRAAWPGFETSSVWTHATLRSTTPNSKRSNAWRPLDRGDCRGRKLVSYWREARPVTGRVTAHLNGRPQEQEGNRLGSCSLRARR